MDTINKVREFAKVFGCEQADGIPEMTDAEHGRVREHAAILLALSKRMLEEARHLRSMPLLRLHLMTEELGEFAQGMAERDLSACLDALCDMRYVADGTTVALNLDQVFEEAFDAVHKSNMSKLVDGRPLLSESGRVLKGPDYAPPRLDQRLVRLHAEDNGDDTIHVTATNKLCVWSAEYHWCQGRQRFMRVREQEHSHYPAAVLDLMDGHAKHGVERDRLCLASL